MKKLLMIFFEVILVLVVFAIGLLAFLTVNEYKPKAVEPVAVEGISSTEVSTGKDLSIVTWNIGYSALGKYQDFAMDGGGKAPVANFDRVVEYFFGIIFSLVKQNADINLIQEFDLGSTRSFYIDMRQFLSMRNSTFAYNYNCDFVPFPWPPLATIRSGVFTTTDFKIENAQRQAVKSPFTWPLCTANLKRCLLVSYLPIEGSTKQLVVINLHLEAYSDSEARIVQLKMLNDVMEKEYAKGNYVIAGGDFNQVFPGTEKIYPNTHKDNWNPNELDETILNSKFKIVYDATTPTCRLLNQPYNPEDKTGTQHYVIDGFIVSPNITVKQIKTIGLDFENSDHNPVKMVFELQK